jgi:folate-binding Fe-S cluster repair protein YgfZ
MAAASFDLLDDRGILAVSGPDCRPFLQGLVSNVVEKVSPAAARYAAFLTDQGKYLFDFMMVEGRIDLVRHRSRPLRRSQAAAFDLPAARQGLARRDPTEPWQRYSERT